MPRGKKQSKPAALVETTTTEAGSSTSEDKVVEVRSPEGAARETEGKAHVMEKSTEREKDTAPLVIVSWTDASGKRRTKQFTCASVNLQEHKSEQLTKSGQKTVLDISIEASVVEVI